MKSIQAVLNEVLNNFAVYRKMPLKGNPLLGLFCHGFRDSLLENLPEVSDSGKFCVKGSIQQGKWCDVIWMMVSKPNITETASKGVYIVYLVATDGSACYLTLSQAATSGTRGSIPLAASTKNIQKLLGSLSPFETNKPNLGPQISAGKHKQEYEDGCICYKKYERGRLPDDSVFVSDLRNMLSVYDVYDKIHGSINGEAKDLTDSRGKESDNVVKETIGKIRNYIAQKGFTYPAGLIENFYLSLRAKPFVILAGVSGTGKTKLVKLFAEAVGATSNNHHYLLVPVRPDWSDSSDLLGHTDLKGNFVPGAIVDFISAANNDLDNPYFLCLDEMNLARVEYYFSDVLSIMETRERNLEKNRIESDRLIPRQFLGNSSEALEKYGDLVLPENLYVIGTVNMDETTFPFSKKVLDRANMIEFSDIDLAYSDLAAEASAVKPEPVKITNGFFKADYLTLEDCKAASKNIISLCDSLQKLNLDLALANMQVGYRVRDEALFYQIYNERFGLFSSDEAFDNVLMQKILPRVQGSSAKIRDMLCDLFAHYVGAFDVNNQKTGGVAEAMDSWIKGAGKISYPKTASKIAYMVRRYQEDGFTSYWL